MASIPKVQTAVVIVSKDEDLQVRKDYPVKQPEDLQPGECLVKILATGVCQSGTYIPIRSRREVLTKR
jgi:propanol-preferring alcohol dehydrogenase